MSLFDGFSEALSSVPPHELRFTFAQLECIRDALMHYSDYLEERDDDHQPILHASDGNPMLEICDSLWKKFFDYEFH